jgi:hypothetical protein
VIKAGIPWTDPDFPPEQSSIFDKYDVELTEKQIMVAKRL